MPFELGAYEKLKANVGMERLEEYLNAVDRRDICEKA